MTHTTLHCKTTTSMPNRAAPSLYIPRFASDPLQQGHLHHLPLHLLQHLSPRQCPRPSLSRHKRGLRVRSHSEDMNGLREWCWLTHMKNVLAVFIWQSELVIFVNSVCKTDKKVLHLAIIVTQTVFIYFIAIYVRLCLYQVTWWSDRWLFKEEKQWKCGRKSNIHLSKEK